MGANTPYEAKPLFWSDHYDVKLQIAGLNTDYNAVVVRDGKNWLRIPLVLPRRTFAGRRCDECPRDCMNATGLIGAGKSPSPEAVLRKART